MNECRGLCEPKPQSREAYNSVVAGGLIVNSRTVFKESPSLQILKCSCKFPNAKILGFICQTQPLYFGEQLLFFFKPGCAKQKNVVAACGIYHHL